MMFERERGDERASRRQAPSTILVTPEPKVSAQARYSLPVDSRLSRTVARFWVGEHRVATRYIAVSVINTVNHQALLFLANSVWDWTGGWANVFAATTAAVPAYLLSRAWVWEVSGRHSFRSEVLPFWTIALVGLLVSTLCAEVADRVFGAGIAVNIASLVGYFFVWVAKFVLLDRMFTAAGESEPTGLVHDT